MSCSCRENLVAYLDGELAPAEADAIRAHIEACADCRAYAGLLKSSYDALEHIEAAEAPAGFAAKVKSRARRRALRPVYAFAALAAAAALLLAIAVRFNIPSSVTPPAGTNADWSWIDVAEAGEGDMAAAEMELVENIDILDDVDILDGVELYYALESLDDADSFQIDAVI